MGTRADFYVGSGPHAEWLGSVGWDGYKWAEDSEAFVHIDSEDSYREFIGLMLVNRDDGTTPDMGWPWPWETSATTDFVYWYEGGKVQHATFDEEHEWPNMTDVQNVTMGKRSGVILVQVPK